MRILTSMQALTLLAARVQDLTTLVYDDSSPMVPRWRVALAADRLQTALDTLQTEMGQPEQAVKT